jgi:catalase (peroxidase I)
MILILPTLGKDFDYQEELKKLDIDAQKKTCMP